MSFKQNDFGVKFLFTTVLTNLLLFLVCTAQPMEIVRSFPAPSPSPKDLTWDGKNLWLIDDSTHLIYKLNPSNGQILLSFSCNSPEPTGLTWDGKHFWYSDNKTLKIYGLESRRGKVISAIDIPVISFRNGVSPVGGLSWDGTFLWCGLIAGWSSGMSKLDTVHGRQLKFLYSKGFPLGVASDGEFLWSLTDNGGLRPGIIYQYKRSNGKYIAQYDVPCDFPVGLVYDKKFFWCIDRQKNIILKLTVKR